MSRKKTDGDALAFPRENFGLGLTKREYFAAAIIAGLMADSSIDGGFSELAEGAVIQTDALIEALNKEPAK